MKLQSTVPVVVAAVCCAIIGGCRAGAERASPRYSTVAHDPRRDTDAAKQASTRAVELIAQGQWDQAEQALKTALEADLTFGPAHNNLGTVYFHQGRLYLAAWEFQYATKLMPNQPQPRNNLGLVLEQAGKLDEAIQNYDQALELEPDAPQILGNAARCRVRRGDKDGRIVQMLEQLLMRETRPKWLQWVKEQLALRGRPAAG